MLETKNNKIMKKLIMMAVLMTGLFVIGGNQAMAQSRIFNFFIQNIDSAPVTIRLEAGGCYEGDVPNGEIWENVPPQGKVKILLARIQGHGCDGEAGGFYLIFSPKVGVKERVAFNFDNSGSLWIVPIANQYPGILGPKAGPSDQSYTYTTFARPKLTASKPQGSWEHFCGGICDRMIKNEITNQTTKESTITEETKSSISVALEAGLEFGAGSASTTVTASLEKTIGKSMSNGVMNSSTTGDEQRVAITLEQSETYNIHAVWRWVAKTTLSNGQSYVVKTNQYTCTPDGNEPTYLPGSKEDIRTCRGKNAVSAEKPQDANPKPTPVETPKPISNPPASNAATARINVALASNGGVATASSTIWKNVPNYPSFPEASAINGDRTGRKWGSGGGWNDETSGGFPDWLQVDFSGQKNIDEINVVTLQDGFETAGEPTAETKFTKNGIKDFVVQYWNGADWVTVPGGSVTGNDLVIRTFKFTPVSTTKIRVTVSAALQDYSRIVQLEAWGKN